MEPATNLVIWAGPVEARNLAGASLPVPARVLTFGHGDGGIGSTAFGNLGRRFGGDLYELADSRGVDLDRCATVTLACFSAGFALVETILRHAPSAARVDALVAGDGYYTGPAMTVKPGYRAFCQRAADRRALAILSTSSIDGPGYPSAQAAVGRLLSPFSMSTGPAPRDVPEPDAALHTGGLLWLKYGAKYGVGPEAHTMHATRVVPGVLTSVVSPYLRRLAGLAGHEPASPAFALAAAGLLLGASELL